MARERSKAAARRGRERPRRAERAPEEPGGPVLTTPALVLGAGGLLVAIVGFWMIAQGSIALAPVLLVLAYLVLFPLALIR